MDNDSVGAGGAGSPDKIATCLPNPGAFSVITVPVTVIGESSFPVSGFSHTNCVLLDDNLVSVTVRSALPVKYTAY